ncbi:MAG: MerR family transcriptional regulator [Dehalococcoidia bacterium]
MRIITGATARQLDYWESKGLLAPSGIGKGERGWRGYTIDDAILARTIRALREDGVSLPKIEEVLKVLSKKIRRAEKPSELLRTLKLVAYGGEVYVKTSTRAAYRAVDGQSTFLFVNIEQIGLEVARKSRQLSIIDS